MANDDGKVVVERRNAGLISPAAVSHNTARATVSYDVTDPVTIWLKTHRFRGLQIMQYGLLLINRAIRGTTLAA
jgi:hypothetical protein